MPAAASPFSAPAPSEQRGDRPDGKRCPGGFCSCYCPRQAATDQVCQWAACHLALAHPRPSREALEQTALLRSHRERLLRQGRLYLLTGAAAREECRQAVCPDTDPRKIRRLGERLIAQEFARGESGTVREGWLTYCI